jgi:hypothetical protein
MQVSFGSGLVAFTPAGSNPTPIVCGVLQDVTLKLSSSQKELYGQNRIAVAVADAEMSISGTAKFAQLYGAFIKNALNGTIATGQVLGAIMRAGDGWRRRTVTVVNSATFGVDLSVYDYTASKPMTSVASAPATGQYSRVCRRLHVRRLGHGHARELQLHLHGGDRADGEPDESAHGRREHVHRDTCSTATTARAPAMKLWALSLAGLDFAIKNTDFMMQDLSFKAYADSQGRVIDLYTAE